MRRTANRALRDQYATGMQASLASSNKQRVHQLDKAREQTCCGGLSKHASKLRALATCEILCGGIPGELSTGVGVLYGGCLVELLV